MTFLVPSRLWLLLGVLAVAVAYLLLQRRRTSYAVRFTELDLLASVAPRRPGWRRHVPAAAFLLMLLALTVGFARPQADTLVARERATVVVALDVSNSMSAVDVSPSRIAAAKDAAVQFISGLPGRLRVGLVAFDGTARLVAAPTEDHASVSAAVSQLVLGPGTAIGEAVHASLQTITDDAAAESHAGAGEVTPAPARIVLLSDGFTTLGRSPTLAAVEAKQAGVPVSTIAYGTPDGVVTIEGHTIGVPADVASLQALARDSGGTAYTAESRTELRSVYADIGSQVGTTTKRTEVTSWLVGLSLLAGAVSAVTALLWTPRLP